MKTIQPVLLATGILLAVVSLPGCGGGNDNRGNVRNFTSFVTQQFNQTAEQTDPVNINGLILVDRDRNNPNAYDQLLSR